MKREAGFDEWWSCWTIKGTKRSKKMAERWYHRALCYGVSHVRCSRSLGLRCVSVRCQPT
jgi:hypothetical protein